MQSTLLADLGVHNQVRRANAVHRGTAVVNAQSLDYSEAAAARLEDNLPAHAFGGIEELSSS